MGKAASPVPVYDSDLRPPAAWEELLEAWRYRDLIVQLVRRDVTARYKRSVLGIAWTMLNPLGMMVVLTVVFSKLFPTVRGYPVFVLSALIAWNFFSQTSMAAVNALVWGGALFQRIYLPKSVFAIAAIGTGLVNTAFALVPLVLVMAVTGVPPRWTVLLTPLTIVPLAAFALGVGLLISAVGIYFADVVEMYNVALTALFYATPIVYPLDQMPASVQRILSFNPLVYLVELFRQPLYQGQVPAWHWWGLAYGIGFVTLLVGWLAFASKVDEFAYRA